MFLWVHLAVVSLISGMCYCDRIEDLQQRLDYLPPDLANLYEKILDSLNPFYLEHAVQLFSLVDAASVPLATLQMSFADNDGPSSAIDMPIDGIPDEILALRLDSMARRLNSRCMGLLEIDRQVHDPSHHPKLAVQYLHRTVRDFMKSDKAQRRFQACAKSDHDPHLQLCIAYLMQTKTNQTIDPFNIHLYLSSEARVLARNQSDMIKLLDDLSRTVDVRRRSSDYAQVLPDLSSRYGFNSSSTLRGIHSLENPLKHVCANDRTHLGADRIGMLGSDMFGENFLSLAVVHDVVPYVRARAPRGWPGSKSMLSV